MRRGGKAKTLIYKKYFGTAVRIKMEKATTFVRSTQAKRLDINT
jgi:hypothetical protein